MYINVIIPQFFKKYKPLKRIYLPIQLFKDHLQISEIVSIRLGFEHVIRTKNDKPLMKLAV